MSPPRSRGGSARNCSVSGEVDEQLPRLRGRRGMIVNLLHRARLTLALAIMMGTAPWCAGAQAQTLEKLSVVIFSAPSLGAFMPPGIKAKKLDQANGLDIAFQERT